MFYLLSKIKTNLHYFLVIIITLSIAKTSDSDTYFRGSGLIDTPTAYIMDNGLFDVGVHIAIKDQKRQEASLKIDFGLSNFAEIGIIGLKKAEKDYIIGNIKVLFAREEGVLPSLAVGVDNLGESVEDNLDENDMSFYAVISKQLNLPLFHLINLNLGVGNKRYIDEESIGKYLHGAFLGINKEFILTSRDIRLKFMGELKGKGVNVGLKCLMKSGISLNLAIGQISSDKETISYHIGISFSNTSLMKEIEQSNEIAKQAVRIANKTSSEANNNQKDE